MAWDAAKRKSVQGYTPGLGTPYPDATKPVGWRAAVAGLFAADSYPALVAVLDNLSYALSWALTWPIPRDHVAMREHDA